MVSYMENDIHGFISLLRLEICIIISLKVFPVWQFFFFGVCNLLTLQVRKKYGHFILLETILLGSLNIR